jgi:hypothetical protein
MTYPFFVMAGLVPATHRLKPNQVIAGGAALRPGSRVRTAGTSPAVTFSFGCKISSAFVMTDTQ